MKRIIGIDPGKHGGIVVIDSSDNDRGCEITNSQLLPYKNKRIDSKQLRDLLINLSIIDGNRSLTRETDVRVYIESRATFGIKAPAYDYNYGIVEAICEFYFHVVYAPILAWKKEFHFCTSRVTRDNLETKELTKVACVKTFGIDQCEAWLYNHAGRFHEGLSDAAGIAYYGWLVSEHEERVLSNVMSVNGLTTTTTNKRKPK